MKQCRGGGGDGGGRVHLKDIPLDNVFLNQVDLETKIETSVDEEVVAQGLDSPYSASSSSNQITATSVNTIRSPANCCRRINNMHRG